MQRLSTPTHIFTLDIDTSLIKTLRIVYKQGEIVRLVKYGTDAKIEGNTVTLKLTQEETLLFGNNWLVDIQLRLLLKSGDALRSKVYHRVTGVLLGDEVMV
jgi:hypothetical protein